VRTISCLRPVDVDKVAGIFANPYVDKLISRER